MLPRKIAVIKECPIPKNLRELRAFLGFCNFYRCYCKGYAHLASPLNRLLQKGAEFDFDDNCEKAFLKLRKKMTESPPLGIADLNQSFHLCCDASGSAIGYVLKQKKKDGTASSLTAGGPASGNLNKLISN